MIMEIKMNNSLTFDEVADKLGCSVEDLQKIAFKKILFSFGSMESLRTFAVRQFYYHIRIGNFLCPILKYCLKYKQRFLRTYSPQSRYGTVASWRNSLLSLFINF